METDSIFSAVFTLPCKLCRGSKRRLSLSLKSRNNALERGLVKMSATWWLEGTKRVSSARKILTAENSKKWNIILVSWCCLCKENGETVDHLLLHCPFSKEIWDLVFALFGLQWLMPRKVIDLLACWQGYFGWDWHRAIWRCIPHCWTWCVWRERNNRSLERCERSV